MESSLGTLNQQEKRYADELETALAQYAELQQKAETMDTIEVDTACQALRPGKERETAQRLQATYQKKFDSHLLTQSRKDVAAMLGEIAEPVSIREKLQQSVEQADKYRHTNRRDQER